jgi:phosphate transport system protein
LCARTPRVNQEDRVPEHIVKSFQEELDRLSTNIAHMGGLAETQLAAALDAVTKRDFALADQVIADDKRIDAIEREIDQQAVRMLALRQPMANDLREVISAIKISSDLERIGDLAKNIGKRARVLDVTRPVRTLQGLGRMGHQALRQLKDVLDAYSERDAEKALAVWRRDEEIDEMYTSLFRELLTYMMEDPRTIGSGTHLLFVAKNLERIGDHATNIAELIHFLVRGEEPVEARPKGRTIYGPDEADAFPD